MKVLFAIRDESDIVDSLVRKYNKDNNKNMLYKEAKNFTAITKEVQENNDYDRIVISDSFDEKVNNSNDKEAILLKKLKGLLSVAKRKNGKSIPVILICKNNKLANSLMELKINNIILKKDASKKNIYELVINPRNSSQAKEYYQSIIGNSTVSDTPKKVEKKVEKKEINKVSENRPMDEKLKKCLKYLNREGMAEANYVSKFEAACEFFGKQEIKELIDNLNPKTKKILSANSSKFNKYLPKEERAVVSKKKEEKVDKKEKEEPVEPKRGRGRPRKNPTQTVSAVAGATATAEVVVGEAKRGRGRPRKNPIEPVEEVKIEEPVKEVVEQGKDKVKEATKKAEQNKVKSEKVEKTKKNKKNNNDDWDLDDDEDINQVVNNEDEFDFDEENEELNEIDVSNLENNESSDEIIDIDEFSFDEDETENASDDDELDFDFEDEDEAEESSDDDFDFEDEDETEESLDDDFDFEDEDETEESLDDDFDFEDEDETEESLDDNFDFEDEDEEEESLDDDFDFEDEDETESSDDDLTFEDEDEIEDSSDGDFTFDDDDIDIDDEDLEDLDDDEIEALISEEDDDEETDLNLIDDEEDDEVDDQNDFMNFDDSEDEEDDDILGLSSDEDLSKGIEGLDDDNFVNLDDDESEDDSDDEFVFDDEEEDNSDDDILNFDDDDSTDDIMNLDDEDSEDDSDNEFVFDDEEEDNSDDDILNFGDDDSTDDIMNLDDEDSEDDSDNEFVFDDEEEDNSDDDVLNLDDDESEDDLLNLDENDSDEIMNLDDEDSDEESDSDEDFIFDVNDDEDDSDDIKIDDNPISNVSGAAFSGIANKNYNPNYDISKQLNEINGEEPSESTVNSNQNDKMVAVANMDMINIGDNQKVVAFVGARNSGTSFIVNNLAQMLSEQGVKTAVVDLTKNKNSYYIYTENEENLRNVAYSSFEKLKSGIADGIKVNKYLTVYTALPNSDTDMEDKENSMTTLLNNYSLVLLDCDFDTGLEFFNIAQDIYFVQSFDILTIQALTSFIKKLKMNKVDYENKMKIIINKYVNLGSINERAIVAAMSVYNSPDTTYQLDLFERTSVEYFLVPFEEKNYCKYLEEVVKCKLTIRGYSKNLLNSLSKLAKSVYPIGKKGKNK